VLGEHKGLIRYTVGQRRGLGISAERPKYVVGKDAISNAVIIGDEEDLYSGIMTVGDVNLIAVDCLSEPVRATVKTRYSQTEAEAVITPLDGKTVSVRFNAPQRAVTPGQSAIFYRGDVVLGGGKILRADKSADL
jgi:tRNA-specific 2-thiouridylase